MTIMRIRKPVQTPLLFAEPNPVVIKGVLHAQGKIPSPAVRLPLLPAGHDTVRAAVSRLSQIPAA